MTEVSLKTLLILLLGYPMWAGAANLSLDAPEAILSEQLTQLESETASAPARHWLEQLLDFQEQARQPHPEHPALDLPRYALAARAQVLLQRWDEQRVYEGMQNNTLQQSKAPPHGPELRARIRWIQQATTQQLAAYRASVAGAALPESLLLAFASKQHVHADDIAIAARGQSRTGLDHLRQRLQTASTTPEQGQALLRGMRQNPRYRGAVASLYAEWLLRNPKPLQQFVQNWRQRPWSQEHLETVLRVRPPQLLQELQAALYQADTASLAAWGLWQFQTAESLQTLKSYISSPDAVPQLAQELALWMR